MRCFTLNLEIPSSDARSAILVFPLALQINFNTFLLKGYVDIGGAAIAIIVAFGLVYGLLRWRKTLSRDFPHLADNALSAGSKVRVLADNLVVDIFYQKSIADCSRTRWLAHFAMFWGFVGLAVTTTLDAIVNPTAGPLLLMSPVRILGNVSGVIFMVGVSLSLGRRLFVPSVRKNSTFGDGLFLGLLFLTGLTGFLTEYLSELGLVIPDSLSYWIHIILVAALLGTAPFTKFVHAIGRPALLLVKRLGNERPRADSGIPSMQPFQQGDSETSE